MAQEAPYDLLVRVLQQIATDIIRFLPKIILVVIVLAVTILIVRVLNSVFRKILELVDLDGLFKKLTKTKLPFSLSNLIIALIDIGIFLIAIFGIANFYLEAKYMEVMREAFGYGARIASVIAVTIFTFMMFNLFMEKMLVYHRKAKTEVRMRGYVIFILLVIITTMIIDLTALSSSTKHHLVQGLSIGLGIAVGIFAVWFFFHDYIERFLSLKIRTQESNK